MVMMFMIGLAGPTGAAASIICTLPVYTIHVVHDDGP
jgi:hypothetical protein